MYFLLSIILVSFFISASSTNQLAFNGGGAFGAVEIGILKRITENRPMKYDRYTGISAGGLNAGFLSHYSNIEEGISTAESIYSTLRNRDVYEILPETGNSILNTNPLHKTLTNLVKKMPSEPVVDTLIGATNLNTGNLDIFSYQDNASVEDKVLLLMSTSAIPIAFPPIKYKNHFYADGGTLSNNLLDVVHSKDFLNITFISPFAPMAENDSPITSIKDMLTRTFQIVKKNFDNPFVRLNHDCKEPYGEVNFHYVDDQALKGFSMLNFDKGAELVEIGYKNMKAQKFKLC